MRFVRRFKSLEGKFLFFLLPPLVLAAAVFAFGHGYLAYRDAEEQILVRQTRIAGLAAEYLRPYILPADREAVTEALAAIVVSPDVLSAELYDTSGSLLARAGSSPGDPLRAANRNVVRDVVRPIVVDPADGSPPSVAGTLLLHFEHAAPHAAAVAEMKRDIFSILVTVIILTVGMIGLYRVLVTTPLRKLSASVKAGETDGAYAEVDWESRDEIGKVIAAFNAAQRLRRREFNFIKRSRQLMAESEARFRAIAEAIPVPLVIEWLSDGGAFYTNAAARQMLCPGVEAPPDNLLASLFVDSRERERYLNSLRGGSRIENRQVLLQRPNGGRFWGSISARLLDLDGRRAVLCAVHDISDHKQAEAALQAAKEAADGSNAAKDMFLANTGHEIRTPLNAILGLSRLALGTDLTPEQWEHLSRIEAAAASLTALIDDVLDFSAIGTEGETSRVAPFSFIDLMTALSAVHSASAAAKGLTFAIEQKGAIPPFLKGDAVHLTRVLNVLVGNAIKFTDSGAITLTAHGARAADGTIRVRFAVHDTGPGLDPSKLSHLIQPFVQGDASSTRKHGGTGLGLAIADSLLARMGGALSVDSTPGAGATFSFTLAFEPATETGPGRHGLKAATPSLNGLRVLLVEDNEVNRVVAQKILQRAGAAVETAENGLAAVAAVDTGADRFDAVLMDLQMPEMDGHEATRTLRDRFDAETLPIVALTAHAFGTERERCLAEGMNDYLTKPIAPDALVETLARIAGRRKRPPSDLTLAAENAAEEAVGVSPPVSPLADLPGLNVSDAMSRMGGDFDLYRELLQMFHGIYVGGLGAVRDPLRRGAKEEARRAAHSLKGVAGNISAPALHKAAAQLELALKENAADDLVAERLAAVESELRPVLETTARFV